MSSLQVTGTVTRIDQPVSRTHGDKTYTSQKFRIKTNEQYPNVFELEVREAKMNILANIHVGQDVTAHINLKGREWEKDGKGGVFMSMDCWKCDTSAQGIPAHTSTVHEGANAPQEPDQLPF